MDKIFSGSGVALITPFKNNHVDFDALENQILKQLRAHTDAIVLLGTTGEPCTLYQEEKNEIISFAKHIIGDRAKLIVGVGSNNTEEVLDNIKFAESQNVDGLLVVTPYYNKANEDGIIAHYTKIANSTDLPIILYNVPSRTGVNLTPEIVLKLSDIPNIIGIKEATSDINQILKLFHLLKSKIAIYSGEDSLNYIFLSLGAEGVISVTANIAPKHVKALCDNAFKKNFLTCQHIHEKLYGLNKNLFLEVNPIPVKTALYMLGEIAEEFRLPLYKMTKENKKILQSTLQDFFNKT